MHAHRYETISTCIHSGAIMLSKLGVPPGRHALDIIAVGLVTGLLDRLPSRGEFKKVMRCDTCACVYVCAQCSKLLSILEIARDQSETIVI